MLRNPCGTTPSGQHWIPTDVSPRGTDMTTTKREIPPMCQHQPTCPPAESADRESARLVAHHPEQGWSLLCNGVLLFEDTGELLPDGRVIAPHRPLGALMTAA
ncbi:hypothetical protein GCM10017776_20740 [Streptomyces griseoluteus]|nr:hypothetical protein GCM10017776_20740 [Streptomyces griseoluteus]